MTHRRLPAALLSAAAVAVLTLPVVSAGAGNRVSDRDHDRMPDRWERAHGLKVARDDARRDRDRDGLRNLAEYRAGLDPRDADTDDDGTRDGNEGAGTIVSFKDGVLVIRTFGGASLTGSVTDRTEIECDEDKGASARSSGDDEDVERREGDPGEDDDDRVPTSTTGAAGPTGDQDEEDEADDDCGPAALIEGARVEEAKLAVTSAGAVWREVELER